METKTKPTHAIKTHLGRVVLGSLTLTKANWIRPSENSSTRSTSSPSARKRVSNSQSFAAAHVRRTASTLHFQNALFAAIVLESADKRCCYGEDGPLAVRRRSGLETGWRRGIDDVLVAPGDVGSIAGRIERRHAAERGTVGDGGLKGTTDGRQRRSRSSGERATASEREHGREVETEAEAEMEM